jgi:type I restriction enzyme S subunit
MKIVLLIVNQRVAKFYSKIDDINTLWFVYCFFSYKQNLDFIINTAQGSAQPNISADGIMSTPMVLSDNKIFQKFEGILQEKFKKVIQNQMEIEILTKLRDTLLPKLISGKIQIKNYKQIVN